LRLALILFACVLLAASARADGAAIHAGVETPLASFVVVKRDASPLSEANKTRTYTVGSGAVGFRAGYAWPWGLELGAHAELSFTRDEVSVDSSNTTVVSPSAYARYLFKGTRARWFAGVFAGGELGRDRSKGDDDSLIRGRYGSFGAELGLQLRLVRWLSIDPFLRYRFSGGETRDGAQLSLHQQLHRSLFGLGVSLWF
jgi:hypothetical protein